ncbi:MAG: hypothetical protein IPM76_16480 [Chloroflexi bacterium]|nr:hypothetical protein [Chloroflexota bacterium]
MSLDKETLTKKIEDALKLDPKKPRRSAQEVANDLANAIEEFVKSGDIVNVSTSVTVTVQTTGTATAQTGTGTGTGTQIGVGRIQ